MNKRRSLVWVVAVLVVLAIAVWLGGDWIWGKLLQMHGAHGTHAG